MIREFVTEFGSTGQDWDNLRRDLNRLSKNTERAAKKILSGDYGYMTSKLFRDFVRVKLGIENGVELREAA